MRNDRQKYLDNIQLKMDALMERIKTEDDEGLLCHLSEAGELLITGLTLFDEREDKYQVVIDTYSADRGYQGEHLIYCTDNKIEARKVFSGVTDALDNTFAFFDKEGIFSM